ncbi:MAG: hypothetical protein AAFN30_10830, partial [Actinomycetota bacterium]
MADDPCPICGPPIELDDDTTLRIAHLGAADGPALEQLHQRLSPTDVHRRFFTGAKPPASFFERWASISEQGGLDLGAYLDTEEGSTLVAEAGYALQSDGDGELGITVDTDARGWLGPWLLDLLLRHAADRGVPNMQAVVLGENKAMLAMAAKRGYAVLGHPEWSKIRLTMSTSGHAPSWPRPHPRPRLLIESDRTRWIGEDELRDAGLDVAVCAGACQDTGHCPVLNGEPCPLVEGADAVVIDLPPGDPRFAELVAAERLIHPAVRLIPGYAATTDGTQKRRRATDVLDDLADLLPESTDR